MSELYNNAILKLAVGLPRSGRLETPDVTVTRTSRICGSRVTVDLNFGDGRIADYAQEVKACALGQAAASVVGREIIGRDEPEIRNVAAQMRAMLAGEGEGPDGAWSDLRVLAPARDHKSRHPSIMLALDAVLEGFRLAGAGETAEAG